MPAKLHAREQKGNAEPLAAAAWSLDLVECKIEKCIVSLLELYHLLLTLPNSLVGIRAPSLLFLHAADFAGLLMLECNQADMEFAPSN